MLGILVVTDVVEVRMVFVLASCLGLVLVVDNPTRQTFTHEMVGPDQLTNAVSFNSVVVNVARVIGPAFAGALIVTVGLAPCFFLNAASYSAVLVALAMMNPDRLQRAAIQARRRGQLTEGVRYVRSTPEVLVPLMMMAVVGTLAYEFQVVLPLLARFTFDGDAGTYATMSPLMGIGAVVGGLATAAGGRRPPNVDPLPRSGESRFGARGWRNDPAAETGRLTSVSRQARTDELELSAPRRCAIRGCLRGET